MLTLAQHYSSFICPMLFPGCKNRAHFISWLEMVKGVPNQGVGCSVNQGSSFVFRVCGLVIWSVKIVPEMTYNVLGGTLSLCITTTTT